MNRRRRLLARSVAHFTQRAEYRMNHPEDWVGFFDAQAAKGRRKLIRTWMRVQRRRTAFRKKAKERLVVNGPAEVIFHEDARPEVILDGG